MADNRTVLVVDDDAYILRVVEVKLRKHGYGVITANNGGDGLTLIKSAKPDAVITDINMPKMDGEALCRMANPLKKEKSFLTIVLSARVNPNDRRWLEEMEDTRFLEKPFSPSQLVACLDDYFSCRSE